MNISTSFSIVQHTNAGWNIQQIMFNMSHCVDPSGSKTLDNAYPKRQLWWWWLVELHWCANGSAVLELRWTKSSSPWHQPRWRTPWQGTTIPKKQQGKYNDHFILSHFQILETRSLMHKTFLEWQPCQYMGVLKGGQSMCSAKWYVRYMLWGLKDFLWFFYKGFHILYFKDVRNFVNFFWNVRKAIIYEISQSFCECEMQNLKFRIRMQIYYTSVITDVSD